MEHSDQGNISVAFYHRNTSEQRKMDILSDLSLPLGHPDKKLLAVVATVSLGEKVTHFFHFLHISQDLAYFLLS